MIHCFASGFAERKPCRKGPSTPGAAFGYDTNNVFYLDNLKLQFIVK